MSHEPVSLSLSHDCHEVNSFLLFSLADKIVSLLVRVHFVFGHTHLNLIIARVAVWQPLGPSGAARSWPYRWHR